MHTKQVRGGRRALAFGLVAALLSVGSAWEALASFGDRNIVFECPCSAEFTPNGDGEGTLVLNFGLRSFRTTRSAEVGLHFDDWLEDPEYRPNQPLDEFHLPQGSLGDVAPGSLVPGLTQSYRIRQPRVGARLHIGLWEAKGERRDRSIRYGDDIIYHEWLSLWPIPGDGSSDAVRYVDILTDTDGDGTGDVNERIAGTDPHEATSTPGVSTVDVLWLYQSSLAAPDFLAEYHHAAVVTNAVYVDNGTNIRFRSAGFAPVEVEDIDEHGNIKEGVLDQLMDRRGADVANFHYDDQDTLPDPCPSWAGGCAPLGDFLRRGGYQGVSPSKTRIVSPGLIAHELGHVMGLVHSYRQGDIHGSFRWSRGHYVGDWERDPTVYLGTIMSYGGGLATPAFSSPTSDRCEPFGRCGLPGTHPQGADALSSLNVIRFQVADEREPKPDSDGDGFIDAADRFPDDPSEWADLDGDGLGDNGDPDVDGDGRVNSDDLFPLDPREWADLDGDGLGDNVDPDADGDGVANSDDLFPFDPLDWKDGDGDGVGDNAQALRPFRDRELRSIVERALGKPAGAPISEAEMAELEVLEAPVADVRDLTGLESALGLIKLALNVDNWQFRGAYSQGVSDLSPLDGLAELETVWLSVGPGLRDLSPLAGLPKLKSLTLAGFGVHDAYRAFGFLPSPAFDLSPLADLPLEELMLTFSSVADLSPLAHLRELKALGLSYNQIDDVAPLAGLSQLKQLFLDQNRIEDISPLADLDQLEWLSLANNRGPDAFGEGIEDVSPLAGLSNLQNLFLLGNGIEDISPLGGLSQLQVLFLSRNPIQDVSPLAGLSQLKQLQFGSYVIPVRDFLAEFTPTPALRELNLSYVLADLSPLATFMGRHEPRPWSLSMSVRPFTDLGPLVKRSLWSAPGYKGIRISGGPLDQASDDRHIPQLRSWGVEVLYWPAPPPGPTVSIPDSVLRTLIRDATSGNRVLVDDPLSAARVAGLYRLYAFNRGIFDLAGLEAAKNLDELFLGSNGVSDLAPLAELPLTSLDLHDNLVSDLSPLVSSDSLETLHLDRNPLSEEALNAHVPSLRAAGTAVEVETVEWTVPAGGGRATFDTSGYFESLIGAGARVSAESSNPALASVDALDGELRLMPGTVEGRTIVTVTAINEAEESATLKFDVAVTLPREVPLFPSAAEASREGFLRVINRSDEVGMVRIDAIDGSGRAAPPVTLALGAGASAHFNSGDFENGNAAKRLTGSAGSGAGDWRLSLLSRLDISAPAYVRTSDGFVTAMHDLAPEADGSHRVATFNPASNYLQVSRLRLINPGSEDASVTIEGVDDSGASPGDPVRAVVDAGSELVLSSDELESGAGLDGALGDGVGKWRLAVGSDQPIRAMSLLDSPTGHLTNLSTVPAADDGGHAVGLFPSASDPLGRQGFIRVINNGGSVAEVRISAFDNTEWTYDPLTLTVPANAVTHVNSDDLELGNADKGLSGRTGSGEGHWRLELDGPADIDVLAYIRTEDGFLTSMHDVVPSAGNRHEVAFLNPGSNYRQVSRLRLINAGDSIAQVRVTGIDGAGASPGGTVRLSLPAGEARSYTAAELEAGTEGLEGALGDGIGKWRLVVESDRPISVMSLLETPTGHLTNLSTVPGAPDGS